LARFVPPEASVLDVGCGDGTLAAELLRLRPDVTITGVEVAIRAEAAIPTGRFDGANLPFSTRSMDVVLLADVIHHARDGRRLLREAARVAAKRVIVKDHVVRGFAARMTLAFMDRVGNRRFGVPIRENYWPIVEWNAAFAEGGLRLLVWDTSFRIYPFPATLVFDRSLQFIAVLEPMATI
jgi:SAM-dependent methyltransferase